MHKITLPAALLAVTASLAWAQANPAAEKFLQNWDLDGNGEVTVAEAVEMRNNVFYTFDANEDGQLDAEEHALFDEARDNDVTAVPEGKPRQIIQMIADGMSKPANDTNNDGIVTGAEFEAGAAAWLAEIDKTGDGVVTIADF